MAIGILWAMDERCGSCGRTFRAEDSFCGGCGSPRPSAARVTAGAAPPPAPVATAAPAKKNIGNAIRASAMIAAFAIVPLVLVVSLGDCGSAEGRMAVTASPHGEWTFVPTGCASMQPYGSVGANLHAEGPNDGAVYVTLDHVHGHRVELEVPGSCQNADGTDCTVFVVPRESCQTFDVNVDPSGTVVNDVRLVDGHVRLECTLEDGARVSGSIVFEGC